MDKLLIFTNLLNDVIIYPDGAAWFRQEYKGLSGKP